MIPILLLSVQAEESQPALYKILDDNVANPLARVPGVGTVSISGAPKREVNVYCDPNKLDAYNLSVETISSIISAETGIRRAVRSMWVAIPIRCVWKVSSRIPKRWRTSCRYAQRCFRLSARCGKSCGLCGGTCTEDV